MVRRTLALSGLLLALATSAYQAHAKTFTSKLHSFTAEVLTDQLDGPWGLAFLPGGGVLITEQDGALRRYEAGKLSRPLSGVPKVKASGQGGLLDIAIDPDFAQNAHVYLTVRCCLHGSHCVQTFVSRQGDVQMIFQRFEHFFRQHRFYTNGANALHVAVAAQRQEACVAFAHHTAQ